MDCPQGEKWPLKRGGHCREVAVVKKLKQDSVYGPYPPRKKKTIVEKWPLVAVV